MALQEIDWNEAIKLASPFPYVLAVTMDNNGKANIIGLGWWTIMNWGPPKLAISVGHARYSHQCLEDNPEFTLCFPSNEISKGAWFAGKKSGKEHDKFAEAGLEKIPAKKVKTPIIKGSTVAFECKVFKTVDVGDHTLFLADIVAIHGDKEKASHIYTIGYEKMLGFGTDLKVEKNLAEK